MTIVDMSHFMCRNSSFIFSYYNFVPGLCRSSVKYSNAGMSATLQPFFALQLDIQSPRVQSVVDALRENFSSEQLEGGGSSISSCQLQQSGSTDQQQLSSPVLTLSLEELPPVLILHLKRMLYDGSTGDCIKVPYCIKSTYCHLSCIRLWKWIFFIIERIAIPLNEPVFRDPYSFDTNPDPAF